MLKQSLAALCGALAVSALIAAPTYAQSSRSGQSANEPEVTDGRSRTRSNRRQPQRQPTMTPEAIKAEAEAALTATSTACAVTDQRMLGMTGENAKLFEVACDSAPGYLVITSTPPQVIDCVLVDHTAKQVAAKAAAEGTTPEANPNQAQPTCDLPGNKDIVGFLKAYGTQAGVPCTIDEARVMGQASSGAVIYEIGCAGADGYWIQKNPTGWEKTECLQVLTQRGTCNFTTPQEQAATVKSWLTGSEAANCDVQNVRLMGQNANGRFIEMTCADAEGVIIRHNAEFAVQQVYPCSTAQQIGGGCTLPGNKPEDAPSA